MKRHFICSLQNQRSQIARDNLMTLSGKGMKIIENDFFKNLTASWPFFLENLTTIKMKLSESKEKWCNAI
jgi:hypothetical protein